MTDYYQEALERFEQVYTQARELGISEYNAMSLATVDSAGRPDVRVVLLHGFDAGGFVFYTNVESIKGRQLRHTPEAALGFYWREIHRQVRIHGTTEAVSDAEADACFATRARAARIGAWASDQSRPLASHAALEQRSAGFAARFEGQEVPRPPHWSGFRLKPRRIEFWIGREDRLHDRILYRSAAGGWQQELLNP